LASKSSRNQREFLIIKEKKMGEVCLDPATGEGVDRSEYERRVKARTKVSEQYRDLLVELKPIWREQIAEAKLDKENRDKPIEWARDPAEWAARQAIESVAEQPEQPPVAETPTPENVVPLRPAA
jgi:HSP90 family molecular chaperone